MGFVVGLRGMNGSKRTAENINEVYSTKTVPGGQHLDKGTTADNGVKRVTNNTTNNNWRRTHILTPFQILQQQQEIILPFVFLSIFIGSLSAWRGL